MKMLRLGKPKNMVLVSDEDLFVTQNRLANLGVWAFL